MWNMIGMAEAIGQFVGKAIQAVAQPVVKMLIN